MYGIYISFFVESNITKLSLQENCNGK